MSLRYPRSGMRPMHPPGPPLTPPGQRPSSNLIETLLQQTSRLQNKLETSLVTTNGLISRASELKTRLHVSSEVRPPVSPASSSGGASPSPSTRRRSVGSAKKTAGGHRAEPEPVPSSDGQTQAGAVLADKNVMTDAPTHASLCVDESTDTIDLEVEESSTATPDAEPASDNALAAAETASMGTSPHKQMDSGQAEELAALREQVQAHKQREAALEARLREMQAENMELKDELGEFEHGLEVIMGRHREQVSSLQQEVQAERGRTEAAVAAERTEAEALRMEKAALEDQMQHMLAVMQEAARADEQDDLAEETRLVQLQEENDGLREMLNLSMEGGAIEVTLQDMEPVA